MMYKSDIANMALGRLGVSSTITDIESDFSTEAKIIKRHFRTSLDYLLEQHFWNFARGTAVLIKQFDNPDSTHLYSYYMPGDALLIRQLAFQGNFINGIELYPDQKIPFDEVYVGTTRLIYTNLSEAEAEYTKQVAENSVFPSHFGRALAALLSKDIAPSLITSNYPKVRETLNADAENDIAHGIADDLTRTPQQVNAESSFVRARY